VTSFLLTAYRSLVDIGTNYVGAQSEWDMTNGALNFDVETDGRRATDLILADIQRNFNGKLWAQNGPHTILRVLKILCGTEHVSMGSRMTACYITTFPLTPRL